MKDAAIGGVGDLDQALNPVEGSGGAGGKKRAAVIAESRAALFGEGGKKRVKERELFAALIDERLGSLKGAEASREYRQEFATQLEYFDGRVQKAANRALKRVRVAGLISTDEAQLIRNQSFGASQLDADLFSLRNVNNPNQATALSATAFDRATEQLQVLEGGGARIYTEPERREMRKRIRAGELAGDGQELDPGERVAINSTKRSYVSPYDGPTGFLFKPQSDHGGKLVVLMPKDQNYQVTGVALKTEAGKLIEQGLSSGYANGHREHFRFNLPGASYPKNILVEVELNSGKKVFYRIDDPANRHD